MNERLQGSGYAAFRGLSFLCLFGVVAGRSFGGDRSVELLVHLVVVPLWFVPTLGLSLLRPVSGRTLVLRNALFALIDANLAMMATAALAADWVRPYGLLGGQAFVVAILCGPVAGGASAVAGFLGFVNGWLAPDSFTLRGLLAGGGTAVAGALCGTAWRQGVPLLARALTRTQPAVDPAAEARARLNEMEVRLRVIAEERDRCQERLHEMEADSAREAERPAAAPAAGPGGVANSDTNAPALEQGATPGADPQARIRAMEEEVARYREERKVHTVEKRRLMSEISELSRDLMAMHSRAKGDGRAAPPAEAQAPADAASRSDPTVGIAETGVAA